MNPSSALFSTHRLSNSMVSMPGKVDAQQPLRDLSIDFEDNIVDLSNLCTMSKRRLLTPKVSQKTLTRKRPPLRKSSFRNKLYPTESKTNLADTASPRNMATKSPRSTLRKSPRIQKSRFEVPPPPPPPQVTRPSARHSSRACQDEQVEPVRFSTPPLARMPSRARMPSCYSMGESSHGETSLSGRLADDYDCYSTVSSPSCDAAAVEVEIAPGMTARLRGSAETWQAVQRGYTCQVDCFCCTSPLLCIANADYVLCPECKVVSPIEQQEERKQAARGRGGVGLGVRAFQ